MNGRNQTWTILELLKVTTQFLSEKSIENPRLNAEHLLSHLLSLKRVDLYLQFERILTTAEVNQYRELIRRRAQYEPLQYIIGKTEFMGLCFEVSPDVLIPRPETELLVEEVLKLSVDLQAPTILDIGTGSGCIAISLAQLWPGSRIIATDVSEAALHMARNNAGVNNVAERIRFLLHDILNETLPVDSFDIIVSNPPYIAADEMEGLEPEGETGVASTSASALSRSDFSSRALPQPKWRGWNRKLKIMSRQLHLPTAMTV